MSGRIGRCLDMLAAAWGCGRLVIAGRGRVRAAVCQTGRVIIRHAPIAYQPMIQPAITEIIAQAGIGGMPRAPARRTAAGRARRLR